MEKVEVVDFWCDVVYFLKFEDDDFVLNMILENGYEGFFEVVDGNECS